MICVDCTHLLQWMVARLVSVYEFICLPFADEMSVLTAKVTGEGDTSDSKHVLHYLPLVTSVVGRWHRLSVCVCIWESVCELCVCERVYSWASVCNADDLIKQALLKQLVTSPHTYIHSSLPPLTPVSAQTPNINFWTHILSVSYWHMHVCLIYTC